MALKRISSGLLLREGFTDLSAWSGTGWSSVADPSLAIFDPSPIALLTPGAVGTSDYDGVRNAVPYQEGGTWYLLYDGGDDTHGWLQQLASSADGGLTWTRLGNINPPGYGDGSGGTILATATGWIEKRGSTYYLHRVVGGSVGDASIGVGITLGPYYGDVWSATSIAGPWSFVRKYNAVPASWASLDILPGSLVYDGTTYHLFQQGEDSSSRFIGRSTASSPGGPYTFVSTAIAGPSTFGDGRDCENPKVFYHSGLGRWVILTNLVNNTSLPGETDQNAVLLSASVTSWGSATVHRIQHLSPLDGTKPLSLMCHWTGPDGALIVEPDGSLPITFGGLGTAVSPGYHIHRTIQSGVLEPSASCARYTHADTTPRRLTRTLSNTDFVAEWSVEFRSIDATNGVMLFEFRRQDDSNYYRLVLHPTQGLRLDKMIAGSETTIQTASAPTELATANVVHRLRLIVSGTSVDAWLNGEHQIFTTDSTYASGTSIAFVGDDCDGDIRLFSFRSAQTVTINGVQSGQVVTLRGAGGIPIATATASGSSIVMTAPHYPLVSFDVAGTSYTPGGPIWGGDVYTLTASALPLPIG